MEVKELIQNGLGNLQRTIGRTLNGLTPAELKWQPRPDANSIGLILFHIARFEDSFIQSRLQGKPQLWESEKWYQKLNKAIDDAGAHYSAEQVAGFVVPKIEDLSGYSEAVRRKTLEYLKDITADDLDRKVTLSPSGSAPAGRPPVELTAGSILLFTLTHTAQHAGEISYLRGL
ncbi:MAG: DinB family protein, partial [Dehalococcoidales bacterium]|nr:DinB family protein [Dehalococcoidales bacterium]